MIDTNDNQIQAMIPQLYPKEPATFPVDELTEKCEKLISEYKKQKQRNIELKATIEKQEKEKLLLTRPQFFDTEMNKLALTIRIYQKTLEDLEIQSQKTSAQLKRPSETQ